MPPKCVISWLHTPWGDGVTVGDVLYIENPCTPGLTVTPMRQNKALKWHIHTRGGWGG